MTLNRRHFIVGAAGTGLATFGWTPLVRAQAIDAVKVLCGYPAGGTFTPEN